MIISTYFQAFHDPIKNENALTEEENESVFVNWNELTMCNMKLLKYVLVTLLYLHASYFLYTTPLVDPGIGQGGPCTFSDFANGGKISGRVSINSGRVRPLLFGHKWIS